VNVAATPVDGILGHPGVKALALSLAASPGTVAKPDQPVKRAAVALLLRLPPGGELELLLIKRAAWADDPWSGHVALPGGREEPDDETLAHTAVRETREETAIDVDAVGRIIGTLDELYPRSPHLPPIVIRPFVGVVRHDVSIIPSVEVASSFWVPVATLADPACTKSTELEVRGVQFHERCFMVGDHVVWGLTERILRQFLLRFKGPE
jgi:8-oxo-dGTP pyrophosphatase MutT (NUDIX family)